MHMQKIAVYADALYTPSPPKPDVEEKEDYAAQGWVA